MTFRGADLPQSFVPMIYAKFMRGLRHGNDFFKLIDSDSYFTAYKRYLTTLLNRPNVVIRIAVLGDDHDVALGWCIVEGRTLHYVHVEFEQRNQGVATALVPLPIDTITNITKVGLRIWPEKLPKAIFNPFK